MIVTAIFAWAILGTGATILAIKVVMVFTTAITDIIAVVLDVAVARPTKRVTKTPVKRAAKRVAERGVAVMDVCVFAAII